MYSVCPVRSSICYDVGMEDVLITNILLAITGSAIVLATIMLMLVLYQVYRILRAVRRVVERVSDGAVFVADEFVELRKELMSSAFIAKIIRSIVQLGASGVMDAAGQSRKRTARRKAKKKDEE